MDEYFLTDKCVIVAYPQGASGKFLINCLCFNPNFQPLILPVFDNHQRQMGLLNLKLDSFIKNGVKEEWVDLQMGDIEFFNFPNFYEPDMQNKNINALVEIYKNRVRKQSHLNVIPCLKQNKFFFKELHTTKEAQFYRQAWPNSKLIIIEDTLEYVNLRYQGTKRSTFGDIDSALFDGYHPFRCMSFLKWPEFEKEYIKILDYLGLEPEYMDELRDFHKRYINYWFPDLTSR